MNGGVAATLAGEAPSAVAGEALSGEAFRRFYEATARPLWAYLAAASRDPGLADDLAQESFVRLLAAGLRLGDEQHRRRYLFRIASNLLRDHWRAQRHAAGPLDEAELLAAVPGPDLDARRDLLRGLARLQPRERQMLWLAHVERLSHQEIAALMGLRRASVRVLLFRARRRLATSLSAGPTGEGAQP